MSHFSAEPQRPAMRRKSSAQNLLSSFKSTPNSIPPPLNLGTSNISGSTTLSFAGAATPTVTTPLPKPEWDAQSLHSDTVGSSLAGAQSPQLGQGTSIEYLREVTQKRIITLTYIRNIHEGQSHWFHTIQISRPELDKVFNNAAMKKRTYRFAILGLSLSTLLDINQPQDLLRGLLNTITEFEQTKEEGDNKSKMRLKFNKSKNQKKGASGIAEYTGSFTESDAPYLSVPSIPFPLDYHEILLSLLDVLSEVYHKISKLLGPSPFPHSSALMLGPLGGLAPRPGVSYLFAGDGNSNLPGGYHTPYHQSNPNLPSIASAISGIPDSDTSSTAGGSLWEIANGSMTSTMHGGSLGGPAVNWSNALGEMVLKIDSKLKKITTTLLKDLDAFARNNINDELASLDPLLRNMNVTEDSYAHNKITYDFDNN